MDVNKYKRKLAEIFQENQVVLAYLFGSAARNTMTALSDIDIAVLFSNKTKESDYLAKRLKIASEIDGVLKTDKTEVVALNQAPPLLKHETVLKGNLLFSRDKALQLKTESQIMKEYEDTKHLREVQTEIMREQIKKGTFGRPLVSPYSKYLQEYVSS